MMWVLQGALPFQNPNFATGLSNTGMSPNTQLELWQQNNFSQLLSQYQNPNITMVPSGITSNNNQTFNISNLNASTFGTPFPFANFDSVGTALASHLSSPSPSQGINLDSSTNTGLLGSVHGTSFFRLPDGTTNLLVETPQTLYQAIRNLTDSAGILNSNPQNLGTFATENEISNILSQIININASLAGTQAGTLLPSQTVINVSPLYGADGIMLPLSAFDPNNTPALTPTPSPTVTPPSNQQPPLLTTPSPTPDPTPSPQQTTPTPAPTPTTTTPKFNDDPNSSDFKQRLQDFEARMRADSRGLSGGPDKITLQDKDTLAVIAQATYDLFPKFHSTWSVDAIKQQLSHFNVKPGSSSLDIAGMYVMLSQGTPQNPVAKWLT
jgi:hypothetical protein